MKKLFFFALLLGLSITVINAQQTISASGQTCACNPNGFNPFKVTTRNGTVTVRCGHQFTVKCDEKINMTGGYKCVGAKCPAKFTAILKNTVTGAVVQNYSAFTFPWNYSFPASGNYSLEIQPICGDNKCTPCVFYFTVVCSTPPPPTTSCDCDVNGWQQFVAYNGKYDQQKVNCNFQFSVKKNNPFKLVGKYVCKGNCETKYKAVLKNNVTGAIVQTYSSFNFPWNYTFSIAGNYKLEIIPICGDKQCQPCVFYFTVI